MIDVGKQLQDAYDEGYKQRDSEIIRCKDCKWWKKKLLGGSCELNIRLMSNDNWFCADGERREANESNLSG